MKQEFFSKKKVTAAFAVILFVLVAAWLSACADSSYDSYTLPGTFGSPERASLIYAVYFSEQNEHPIDLGLVGKDDGVFKLKCGEYSSLSLYYEYEFFNFCIGIRPKESDLEVQNYVQFPHSELLSLDAKYSDCAFELIYFDEHISSVDILKDGFIISVRSFDEFVCTAEGLNIGGNSNPRKMTHSEVTALLNLIEIGALAPMTE